ncbi:MAG TPA: amidase family protein, partial [Turneriella sp.]|nr:amidase family protein [Turneriella sp.]
MAHKNKAKRVHAFGNDVLGERDATALAHLIKRREVSALEVAKAAVERAERVNTALHAVELPTYEQALRDAVNPPAAGIFAGVPTFIKDNADVSGLPTRTGTRATKGHTAKKHGDFTAQFIRQGFTVLGKTTMPEFGFNASTEFLLDEPTHNPWNTDFSSGGSSGGSAAMVAA